MKIRMLVMSLAVGAFLFTACNDNKKKEEEARLEKEKMEMEQKKADEEAAMKAQMEFEQNTIAAKAMSNDQFSTLVSALQSAELAETFKNEGEYTVFAPTNAAFDKVPKNTLTTLMKPENKSQLQNLLKYHVVEGEWKADAVIKAINDNNNAYKVTTLAGENITLSLKDGNVMLKDAKGKTATVVMADVDASNGVIHGIDAVVMPKA